jgi:hypothetical protein
MSEVPEGSGYKTVSNAASFVISNAGGTFQNINAFARNVISCGPVQVYTAATPLNPTYTYIFVYTIFHFGDRGSTVVKVLCYKSEGRWFDSKWCQ